MPKSARWCDGAALDLDLCPAVVFCGSCRSAHRLPDRIPLCPCGSAVKIRGAAFTDEAGRAGPIGEVERYRAEHETLLATYENGRKRDFPDRDELDAGQRLQLVVLHGGIAYERMLIDWLDEVLATLRAL